MFFLCKVKWNFLNSHIHKLSPTLILFLFYSHAAKRIFKNTFRQRDSYFGSPLIVILVCVLKTYSPGTVATNNFVNICFFFIGKIHTFEISRGRGDKKFCYSMFLSITQYEKALLTLSLKKVSKSKIYYQGEIVKIK